MRQPRSGLPAVEESSRKKQELFMKAKLRHRTHMVTSLWHFNGLQEDCGLTSQGVAVVEPIQAFSAVGPHLIVHSD